MKLRTASSDIYLIVFIVCFYVRQIIKICTGLNLTLQYKTNIMRYLFLFVELIVLYSSFLLLIFLRIILVFFLRLPRVCCHPCIKTVLKKLDDVSHKIAHQMAGYLVRNVFVMDAFMKYFRCMASQLETL